MVSEGDNTIELEAKRVLVEVLPPSTVFSGGVVRVDGCEFPVKGGVLRFREDDDYNTSFGLQWHRFRRNQFDGDNGTDLSRRRFAETDWSDADLKGRLVLESGCGAGRFTRILADAGSRLVSFDYSSAVEVNRENNAGRGIAFLQCDVFEMLFREGTFDFIFCHGVLQHTPDPERAFRELVKMLKPGGRISIDVYRKDGLIRPWKSKYLWRWLTTRMSPTRLMNVVIWYVPRWLPIDTFIKRIPVVGTYLGSVIPCWNYYYTQLSPEQKVQWAIMDTYDALAPRFDIPAHIDDVQRWFRDAGLMEVVVRPGGNGVVGNGRRPIEALR